MAYGFCKKSLSSFAVVLLTISVAIIIPLESFRLRPIYEA